MQNQLIAATPQLRPNTTSHLLIAAPDMSRVCSLTENDREATLAFLAVRPVQTVVMSSFITDNGVESELNRGKFFAYRNAAGKIEGIALIGHTTLVEARSDDALRALAFRARKSETPIHLIMSSGDDAATFWKYMTSGTKQPVRAQPSHWLQRQRLRCKMLRALRKPHQMQPASKLKTVW